MSIKSPQFSSRSKWIPPLMSCAQGGITAYLPVLLLWARGKEVSLRRSCAGLFRAWHPFPTWYLGSFFLFCMPSALCILWMPSVGILLNFFSLAFIRQSLYKIWRTQKTERKYLITHPNMVWLTRLHSQIGWSFGKRGRQSKVIASYSSQKKSIKDCFKSCLPVRGQRLQRYGAFFSSPSSLGSAPNPMLFHTPL